MCIITGRTLIVVAELDWSNRDMPFNETCPEVNRHPAAIGEGIDRRAPRLRRPSIQPSVA